jgi:YihY family inner membrane protein
MSVLQRFDSWQQRHRFAAIPIAVIKKFGDDGAGGLAALVAYYAFFSLFPLLLVFVTVLGFVLQHNAAELHSIEQSVGRNFPGLSRVLDFSTIHGSPVALVTGIAVSLYSGLGVTNAAQNALDTVWAVPRKNRPNYLQARVRGVGLLASVGLLFVLATGASGIVSGGLGGPLAALGGIVLSLLVNVVLFLAAFRRMTAREVPTRSLWVGVIVAALAWTVLQSVGGLYIGHVMKHLSATYSTFALIIALIVWLHLGAQITLYAAEVSVVIERGLYPRTLIGPPRRPADEEALRRLAKTEERSERQRIEVTFRTDAPDPRDGSAPGDADTVLPPRDTPRTGTPAAPRSG